MKKNIFKLILGICLIFLNLNIVKAASFSINASTSLTKGGKTKLTIKGPSEMDAFTYSWFDQNQLLGADGAHHGNNYICYSFYLKNVNPTTACEYTFGIKFTKDTKNVSAATRIMIIESRKKK